MNRRPTDLRRYVLVRNLKRYVKAHESNAPSNEKQESIDPEQESIADPDPNVKGEIIEPPTEKQETIDLADMKQETTDPSNVQQESTLSPTSFDSEKITLCSSPSDSVEDSSSTKDTAATKDTDLNTSAFAIVASLFKPRKKHKKGIAKAKTVIKGSKCKKKPLTCAKEKDTVSRKPRSMFSLFKTRKEKRNNTLDQINEPCSSVSSTPETTSQSCQTDITWPEDGYELQRSNQVLQESNRLLIENLSTLIQNFSSNPTSPQPPGICTDTYGSECVNYNVVPQPSYSGSIEAEPKSTIKTRSNASKLHRSQTLMESCNSYKICTRSKSMRNTDRQCSPLRIYSKTPSNFLLSSPYQLRSTILKDLPINTNNGIHRRSSMPERTNVGPMRRPLLRRRSNNIFDYNHGAVPFPILSNAVNKPLSENFPLNKVRKTLVRRSSMPDRVPKDQVNFQLRSAVQRRNTLNYHDKRSYKQSEYNCSMRFQDLPKEAFY